jgi:hypothetical protein
MSQSKIVNMAKEESAEEYRARIDRHRKECKECIFVASIECIAVTRNQREKCTPTFLEMIRAMFNSESIEDRIIELGYFSLPGWSGHLMFYLFYCTNCHKTRVSSRHGYEGSLRCGDCGLYTSLRGKRFSI